MSAEKKFSERISLTTPYKLTFHSLILLIFYEHRLSEGLNNGQELVNVPLHGKRNFDMGALSRII